MPEHSTIRVRFIDAKTGELVGETDVPAEQLPESFEAATSLDIGENSFEVVSAEPMTAQEFRQTGTVSIALREVEYATVDPNELRYSLPSISDELPPIAEGSTKLGRNVLELREDDWRQVEFVALALQPSITTAFAAIERIYTEHREEYGFTELHVRNEVPAPLEGTSLTLAELRGAVGEAVTWLDGVSFEGVAGLVEGGFAVKLPSGPALYGLQNEGRVSVLGLHHTKASAAVEGDARLLAALASKHQVCLVDWCRVEQLPPSAERLQAWLSGQD
ncbi:hypothetical protein ATI61_10277 [Archangium gephyra]|uniref:Uncharacterized protein n=1 Tax=Archangium gephyra TaxID=48 RepID=A0AAC8QCN0_9BACT|nr:hypothetical protein [Archangium gephyra]AKJ05006.1 Hypothetical protein AA314_06632 [Archangium gephyra]REG35709.1 hypothetical protein ATI61_10277 [Archangium gephyra]